MWWRDYLIIIELHRPRTFDRCNSRIYRCKMWIVRGGRAVGCAREMCDCANDKRHTDRTQKWCRDADQPSTKQMICHLESNIRRSSDSAGGLFVCVCVFICLCAYTNDSQIEENKWFSFVLIKYTQAEQSRNCFQFVCNHSSTHSSRWYQYFEFF